MNKYINVDEIRQKKLRLQFPDLIRLDACEDSDKYTYFGISIFDHWLSRDEAEDLLGSVTSEEQQRRNSVFDAFNDKLFEKTEVLSFIMRGNYRKYYKFRNFTSDEALKAYIEHSSDKRYQVVLPDLNIVYFESYDDTNAFYLRDINQKYLIENLASEVGLHILDKQ